jgi:tetratricopeptide (TPR) repeat protein
MKPRLLRTTALITIAWLISLGEIKPATAASEQNYKGSINQAMEINSGFNYPDMGRQCSTVLLFAGAGVFSWLALKNGKTIFTKQQFYQEELKQTIPPQQASSTDISIKEQPNYHPETTDISTYIKRAYSHFKQGNTQQAIEEFNQAIGFNPHSAYLYGARANFRRKNLGDKLGAIEDYSKAICIHPQNALFYLWRSQAYNDLGEQRKAIEDYNTALRLAPDNTMYHCFLGTVNSRE